MRAQQEIAKQVQIMSAEGISESAKCEKLMADLQKFRKQHIHGDFPSIRQICHALTSDNTYNKLVVMLQENRPSPLVPNITHWLFMDIKRCLWQYSKDKVSPRLLKESKLIAEVFDALLLYMPQDYCDRLDFSVEHSKLILKPISNTKSFSTLAAMTAACERSELIKLVCAAANNDLKIVEKILASAEFDISQTITCIKATPVIILNHRGGQWPEEIQVTAMHIAILYGHVEMVRLLLEKGFNIEANDGDGKTPLHMAALTGHIGLTELLLERGANPNVLNKEQNSPLHLAILSPKTDLETISLCDILVNNNADPNIGRSQHPEDQRKPSYLALKYHKCYLHAYLLDVEQNIQPRSIMIRIR